jgi:penicillin amidase
MRIPLFAQYNANVYLDRLLKYINTLIAAAIVVALAMVYWYAYRPLPQTSGAIEAFVSRPVTITRDALGTPHIAAESLEDALFAQGYATAQDRLWQMDSLRRLAAGELAEIVGAAALEADRESRGLRLRHLAEDAARTMPVSDRAAMAAYARGVNAFIETHRNNLPLEFTLLGYQPRPWSVADCALIGLHMFRTLTTTWKDEILKRGMLARGDTAKVNFLFPVRTGSEVQPGSNAWAIAGKLTASGKPILANDMHLEFSLPGIWYMAHLQCPGWNVAGVSLPGTPGIIVGHNDRIAWGITNLQFDVQDLYVEQMDDRSGRYMFRGQPEQARVERELILVKRSDPAELNVWVTRHGPLLAGTGAERLSLRWTAAEPGMFQFPILDIDRARNWQEFTTALSRFPGPGSNFVYADVDGNIGYHAAGKLPIRNGWLGDVPVDGASGKFEWQGFIPFEQLPAAFNPPTGMIVTSNQNPFPPDYPYPVNGNFASHFRSTQIRQMLSARAGWRPQEMLTIQKDVYSDFGHFLAGAVVAAYDKRKATNPSLKDAIALLRGWNGQMEYSQAAPLLATLAYQHLRRAVAESASKTPSTYEYQMAPAVLEKLLRTRPPGWFADYDEALLRAAADAVEEGQRMQGPNVNKWSYGKYIELTITHPVTHQIPFVGSYFDIGPVPMSGSSTTVKQTTKKLGPSMRMAADLSDWDRSLLNVTIGQSGQILSSHYRDEWAHYYVGASFPMRYGSVQGKAVLRLMPSLR